MKTSLFLFLCLFGWQIHAQSEVYYYKDSESLDLVRVVSKNFKPLHENRIQERHSEIAHWFKIPAYPTDSVYIFRVPFERFNEAQAYQGNQQLAKLSNERYLSYRFTREQDVFIRIDPALHDYIPIDFKEESKSILQDKKEIMLNFFYYGFAFLIVIYNLGYYFVFKDDAFLHYALLLLTVSIGIFTLDGMLNFYGITGQVNNTVMILNFFFLAYFSSKFAKSYLFLNDFYPKTVRFTYGIGFVIVGCGILYLFTLNYYYLLAVNMLVFFYFYCTGFWVFLFFEKTGIRWFLLWLIPFCYSLVLIIIL